MQVITAHDECQGKVLRFSFIDRMRPLHAIGAINRSCKDFCSAIDKAALAAHSDEPAAQGSNGSPGPPGSRSEQPPLSPQRLAAMGQDRTFLAAVKRSSAEFDKVCSGALCC